MGGHIWGWSGAECPNRATVYVVLWKLRGRLSAYLGSHVSLREGPGYPQPLRGLPQCFTSHMKTISVLQSSNINPGNLRGSKPLGFHSTMITVVFRETHSSLSIANFYVLLLQVAAMLTRKGSSGNIGGHEQSGWRDKMGGERRNEAARRREGCILEKWHDLDLVPSIEELLAIAFPSDLYWHKGRTEETH